MQHADILVVSDTHGAYKALYSIVADTNCDTVIFCGDGIREARAVEQAFAEKRFYCVKGNCDLSFAERSVIMPHICQRRIYITHGCEVPRTEAAEQLIYNAIKNNCDTVFFGHTHRAECIQKNGVFALNPGSLCHGGTYATVTVDGANIEHKILKI